MRSDIPYPLGGLNDNQSFDEQPPRTTEEAVNVRGVDPRTGRARGAQRSGTSQFNADQVNGSNKIRDLQKVTFDNATTTFANRASGSETTEFSKVSPTTSDSVNVRTDRQGNQVWIDGRASLVKYNPTGTKLWTITLPTTDTGHQCLALAIDESDNVIVGVSSGGAQSTARVWAYAQEEDNKTRLLWEMDLGGYVEELVLKNAKLYALVNKPDIGAAEVVTLESYDAPNPEETARWRTAPDANGLDIGADGSVFVAAQANTTRGLNPLAPNAGATSEDWNPTMLSQWGTRAWAWYDAAAEDALNVTPITGAPDDDGGSIGTWYDMTGNGRHLYGGTAMALTSRVNPTLRLRGSSGKPSVFFNGTTSKMISNGNVNVTDDFQQLSTLPGYTGGMFVLFAVVKMNEGLTDKRWLFGQRTTAGDDNRLFLNRDAGTTLPGSTVVGSTSWFETGVTTGLGLNTHPNNYPFNALHPWNAVAQTGSRNVPNGFMVVTLAFTNAQALFSSFIRINGNPVDVWTSPAATWTDGFQLGEYTTSSTGTTQAPSGATCFFFGGEVMEILVLRDYRTSSGVLSLIEAPTGGGLIYPDANFGGIPNTENTEVQKVEGYLAHKWGCAHVLPAGTAARLNFLSQPNNNDTVTIGATTYTFKTALTPAANEVLRGASAATSALNLIRAVNLTGTAGTDYGGGTALNASMWAFPQRFNEDADATPSILFRSLTKITSPAIATTESTAGVRMAWTATTAQTSLAPDAAGENTGFYPHPFSDKRVYNTLSQIVSTGGPPRQSNSDYVLPSKAALLYSPYGLLAKHADSGRPRWIATSEHNTPTVAIGGVGYHVRLGSAGEVFSCGARQAAVNGGSADNVDVRRIVDSGDSFSLTGSAWTAAPGALTYAHPRMAVDKYDNLYLPLSPFSSSFVAYHKTAGTVLIAPTGITEDPVGYAVAIDPNYPEFPDGYSNPRARFVYLAAPKTSSSYALFKVGLVSQVAANVAPRSTRLLALAGTGLRVVTASTIDTPAGSPNGFDSTAKLVSSTVLHRKVYYTDGVSYFVYDPKVGAAGTMSAWAATSSGTIPERMRLICTWRARIVLARSSDNPSLWAMSKLGDPLNWDFFPADITADQAVIGTTARAGLAPDVVNALVPYSDDLLIFGGDSSVWRLTGDPMAGGQFDLVSDITGMSFGPCWDKDPNGVLYFFGSRGGVYRMMPGGVPVSMTDNRVERRMRDVDLSTYYVRCIWDTRENGLHVYVIPFGAASAHVTHWFWEQKTDAWWEDEFGTSSSVGFQPTAALAFDGDDPDDRRVLLGCGDGRVRIIDEAATNDGFGAGSAVPIDSYVTFGPFEASDPNLETRYSGLVAQLAGDQDGANYEVFVSDSPDARGEVRTRGWLHQGRNDRVPFVARGTYFWLRLRNAAISERWAFEAASLEAAAGGMRRVRT